MLVLCLIKTKSNLAANSVEDDNVPSTVRNNRVKSEELLDSVVHDNVQLSVQDLKNYKVKQLIRRDFSFCKPRSK